ncbi:MAG: AAA family ATPase, partial [Acidimicrobiia bacterium]
CADAARAETLLAGAAWDVLVAGPSVMHRAGLRRLSSIHERFPWISIVLALQERPRADLAEIIQVGANDLVPLHADDDELRRTLSRAARITRTRLGVMVHGPGGAGRGRIVMISSASGGCGKTFLATNAAEFLARTTDEPVVLLDLDLQFGEVSTALRLRPNSTITDALAAEAEGYELEEILDEYLLLHPDGFKVLAAPRLPAEADSVTPGDITRILDVLRARQAWVVIDTHEGLSDLFVAALEAADHVFAVATPDRPSLVNLGRYLSALERLGMAAANISVVLNKAEDDTGLDAVDMAAQLGRRFEAIVPYSRDVPRSVNVGVPLIVGKPKSAIANLLTTALSAVLPGNRPVEPLVAPAPVASAPVAPAVVTRVVIPDPSPVVDTAVPSRKRRSRSTCPKRLWPGVRPPSERARSAAADGRSNTRCPVRAGAGDLPAICPGERGCPPQENSPHSSPVLVPLSVVNDPGGLCGMPRTPPTKDSGNKNPSGSLAVREADFCFPKKAARRARAAKPETGDSVGDAPVLADVDPRLGDLRDRRRCRAGLVHRLGRRKQQVRGLDHHHDRSGRDGGRQHRRPRGADQLHHSRRQAGRRHPDAVRRRAGRLRQGR